jgi:hypothetical protein
MSVLSVSTYGKLKYEHVQEDERRRDSISFESAIQNLLIISNFPNICIHLFDFQICQILHACHMDVLNIDYRHSTCLTS